MKERHDFRPRFPRPEIVVVAFLIDEENVRRNVGLLEEVVLFLVEFADRGKSRSA